MTATLRAQTEQAPLRVLFAGWFKYPYGSAGASRIRHLAKGLVENGAVVQVITAARIDVRPADLVAPDEYVWEGVRYRSANLTPPSASVARRAIGHFSALLRSWRYIRAALREGATRSIYSVGQRSICIRCFGWRALPVSMSIAMYASGIRPSCLRAVARIRCIATIGMAGCCR
jgi:hypothetical protein